MEQSAAPTALEQALMAIPGASTPFGRASIFGGAGLAFAYTVRPSLAFHADGSPRKWIVTNGSDPEATIFPWWAFGLVPAVLFSVLV